MGSILSTILLIIITPFAIGFLFWATILLTDSIKFAALATLGFGNVVRCILVIPAFLLAFFLLLIGFNFIHALSGIFGDSFLGTILTRLIEIIQFSLMPFTIIITPSVIAPKFRMFIAVAIGFLVFLTFLDILIEPEGPRTLYYFFILIIGCLSVFYALSKVHTLNLLLNMINDNENDSEI